jgi:hypothetical protein
LPLTSLSRTDWILMLRTIPPDAGPIRTGSKLANLRRCQAAAVAAGSHPGLPSRSANQLRYELKGRYRAHSSRRTAVQESAQCHSFGSNDLPRSRA